MTLNIAKEFSKTPGARYKNQGPFSGQEFRDNWLLPKFMALKPGESLKITLDGVIGYATSFLEEAFGGLVRALPSLKSQDVLDKLEFVSDDDPLLVDDIKAYIKGAQN
jgi:hypothetical protein